MGAGQRVRTPRMGPIHCPNPLNADCRVITSTKCGRCSLYATSAQRPTEAASYPCLPPSMSLCTTRGRDRGARGPRHPRRRRPCHGVRAIDQRPTAHDDHYRWRRDESKPIDDEIEQQSRLNRPGFSRHSGASRRTASRTLPERAGCCYCAAASGYRTFRCNRTRRDARFRGRGTSCSARAHV